MKGIDNFMVIYAVSYGWLHDTHRFFSTLDKAKEFVKKQYPIEAQKMVDSSDWDEEDMEIEEFLEDIEEDCNDIPINEYGFAFIYEFGDLIEITKYPVD